MIHFIKGILAIKKPPEIVIDVNGIGYGLSVSMNTIYDLPEVGEPVSVLTVLIVREDSQTLYGFSSERERSLFQTLIKVNGVGPKSAITILSSIDPDSFVHCILANDTASLTRLPGIGKKTAERLVIDMRDRLDDWQGDIKLDNSDLSAVQSAGGEKQDAISALVSLGYKPQEAKKAIDKIEDEGLNSEQLIRQGLKNLVLRR